MVSIRRNEVWLLFIVRFCSPLSNGNGIVVLIMDTYSGFSYVAFSHLVAPHLHARQVFQPRVSPQSTMKTLSLYFLLN